HTEHSDALRRPSRQQRWRYPNGQRSREVKMSLEQTRNYLGVFFLGATTLIGAYILLFQETAALPIPARDATSAFQIIIPTFVAQLTVIFKWVANPPRDLKVVIAMPKWAVVGPPICV